MEFRNMVMTTLYARQQKRHRCIINPFNLILNHSCFLVKFISKQEFWFPYTFRKVVFTNHLLVYTNMVYRNSKKKKNDAFKLWCWAKETRIERHTCTPIFITAPFIIARTWKQPRCPLADEWVRKLWYIYTMEYWAFF